jgi:hypothetical protein
VNQVIAVQDLGFFIIFMDFALALVLWRNQPILDGITPESDSKVGFWDDFVMLSSVLVRFFSDRDRDRGRGRGRGRGLTIVKDWLFNSCVDSVSIGIVYLCSVSIL